MFFQELEMKMKAHGLQGPGGASSTSEFLSDMLKQQHSSMEFIKQEPSSNPMAEVAMPPIHTEDLMEDTSPIGGDPMLSASSPIITDHSQTNSVSMEDATDMLE